MGNIIASCGHRLTRRQADAMEPVQVRGIDREGRHIVKILILCPKCLRVAQRENCVFASEAEGRLWTEGIGEGGIW